MANVRDGTDTVQCKTLPAVPPASFEGGVKELPSLLCLGTVKLFTHHNCLQLSLKMN